MLTLSLSVDDLVRTLSPSRKPRGLPFLKGKEPTDFPRETLTLPRTIIDFLHGVDIGFAHPDEESTNS